MYGAKKVAFTGGEPLLHPQLLSIIEGVRALNYKISLNTNATMLEREIALYLKKYDVFLYISVDGADATLHERIRGEGSFEAVCKGIEEARKANLPFATVFALTSLNIDGARDFLHFSKQMKALFCCFIPIIPKKEKKELLPSPLQLWDTFFLLQKEAKTLKYPVHVWCTPAAASLNEEYFCAFSCTESMDIDAEGWIHPCDTMEERIVNVFEKDIEYILFAYKSHSLVKWLQKTPSACKTCKMHPICKGGCRVRAYNFWEDMDAKDPICIEEDTFNRG